ncbi:MAG: hypothetical protein KKF33_05155 [Alphaproteobacteria bacterium]|nr:hypothetical protein [Alphaproteobacteria bacterium]
MTYLRTVLLLIAVSQLALGVLTLLAPAFFIQTMGLNAVPTDGFYLLGMLAARFLAIGVLLVVLARRQQVEPLWLQTMVGIQLVDLGVGLYYTATGILPLTVSAFPMFNAVLFSGLLLRALLRPQRPALA